MFLQNSRHVIVAGFVLIVLLMATLMLVSYARLAEVKRQMESIVNHHNAKIATIYSMRGLVRERSLSMYAMSLMQDPFDRQDEFLHFNGMVDEFIGARARLLDLGLTSEEQPLFDQAMELIRTSQPLQAGIVNSLLAGDRSSVHMVMVNDDLPLEKRILALFDQMLDLGRRDTGRVIAEVERADHNATLFVKWLALAALVLSGLIAAFVTRWARRIEEALSEEKERAEVTLHSIGDAVITTNADGIVTYLNAVAEELTGWSARTAAGLPLRQVYNVISETTRRPIDHPALDGSLDGRIVSADRNTLLVGRRGHEVAIEDTAAPIRDAHGCATGTVLVFRDVTRARTLAQQLSYQASHDTLTGLVNRREFERLLAYMVEGVKTQGKQHALLYLDLDQFKLVNDTCGHVAGDELLKQLASLLQSKIRDSDTLARLGGDEFGILLEGCQTEKAERIANELRTAVQDFRFVRQNKVFKILVSIGLVSINHDSGDVAAILSAADAACYMAKERGRNRVWVHQADDAELVQRHGEMQWISRLTHALEEERLELYWQSIRPVGGRPVPGQMAELREVLVRLRDEQGRLVMPMAFIPAAERYGMMSTIDRWVVRHACGWLAAGARDATAMLSINVSSQSLSDDHFLDYVVAQLDATGTDPARVCFELTETAAIADWNRALRFVTTLKQRGCRFALDDFGSGMSSFAYLRDLPVDLIKIDGTFVRNMIDDEMHRSIVEAINAIAHALGILTVAEFAENDRILARLRNLGVDYAQGYAIHKPEPINAARAVSDRASN